MAKPRAYLDYNASAPLLPAAREPILAALSLSANPSSVHHEGRAARRIVEDSRAAVAVLAGGRPEHVVFTSGATEAASTLLTPDWRMGRMPLRFSRLYVSAADHPCLLNGGRFAAGQVVRLGVDGNGIADLAALREALAGHDRDEGLPLVAIHWVNNETGVVQPVAEIGRIVREAGGTLVVDAVQAAGRVAIDLTAADFLILSAHKIGGPAGVGAIVGRADLMMPAALISGGGQEKGFRAGTENFSGIAGFGAAAREALAQLGELDPIRALRDEVEAAVRREVPEAVIFGEKAERVCNTTFFAVPGLKAETAQIAFDLAGVALSAGSACSSGKVGPSHVLKAMGVDNALGALRVSVGRGTTREDIALFETALAGLLARRGAERAA